MALGKLGIVVSIALITGCGSYTRTVRVQKAFYAVERPAEVALVSVHVPREVMERAPSDLSNMRGMIASALEPAFAGSSLRAVDKVDLGFTLKIEPKGAQTVNLGSISVEAPVVAVLEKGAIDRLGLTPREAEVLSLVAAGQTNRQIGEALFVSDKTASVHVSNILRKLGVSSRVDAAAVAQRLGVT